MARPKEDKIRTNITLDKEMFRLLKRRKVNKSSLINSLLWKFVNSRKESPNPNHSSPNSKSCSVVDYHCGLWKDGDWGEEYGVESESGKSMLFSVYKTHKNDYFSNLYDTKSQNYSDNVKVTIEKIFMRDDITPENVMEVLKNCGYSLKYSSVAFRNFLKYCDDNDLIPESLINKFKKRVKINFKKNIDSFIPTKKQIDDSLNIVEKKYPQFLSLYRLMIETGARFSEIKHYILTFDKSKVIYEDDIVLYSNFYLRNNKNSFYLFCTRKTFDKLLPQIKSFTASDLDSFRYRMMRCKEIISVKYLRKYNMQTLLENDVPLSVCDYIQGRVPNSIGFAHYTDKKLLAIKEYKKIILFF